MNIFCAKPFAEMSIAQKDNIYLKMNENGLNNDMLTLLLIRKEIWLNWITTVSLQN